MISNKFSEKTLGILLVLTGTLLYGIMDALIKWLAATYPITQIAFIRAVSSLVLIGLFVLFTRKFSDIKTSKLGMHSLRGFFLLITTLSGFYAIKHIPLVEFAAIAHAVPIIIAVLAPWLLQETTTKQQWFIIAVGFLGVLIIVRPNPDHFHIAHLFMLGGAFAYALMIIAGRHMAQTESQISMNIHLYPVTAILTGVVSQNNWVAPTNSDWLMLIAMSVCATLALVCYMKAMKHVEVTIIAPLEYMLMVWAIIFDYSIWDEVPDLLTCIGIVLIIGSGIYLVTHNRKVTETAVTQTLEH